MEGESIPKITEIYPLKKKEEPLITPAISEDLKKQVKKKYLEANPDITGNSLGNDFLGFFHKEKQPIYNKPYKIAPKYLEQEEEIKIAEFPIIEVPEKFKAYTKSPEFEQLITQWKPTSPLQTETAEAYQKQVLIHTPEDPTLTDFSVAYKRLVQERNKPWKLNLSDIADFYLLESFVARHEGGTDYQEDPTYFATAKAKGQISEIGKRLLVSLAHEQLDEYDRFASVTPDSVPDDLRDTIHTHYTERIDQSGQQDEQTQTQQGLEREINAYLADFNAMLEGHADRGKIMEIFTNKQTAEMFGNAVRILESQQRGRWKVMATAMRALLDPSIPMGEFVKKITATDNNAGINPEMEATLERRREPFLIDRLLNYVHNTGTMSARVTNYFPRAASLLLAHGMPGHQDYLLYHSSLLYGNDGLARQVRQGVSQEGERDLVEDLTTAMQEKSMPREYKYAMLLEFGDEKLHEAVLVNTGENITPTRAYALLQRVSHHDGHSKGRLKQVVES